MVRGAVRGRRWLAAAFLALLGLGSAEAAPFDAQALKTIPLGDLIRLATSRYSVIDVVDDADRDLKNIETLDPKVQTLVWLAILDNGLTVQTEANDNAPSSYIGKGRFFRRFEQALVDAGLGGRAAVLVVAAAGQGGMLVTVDLGPGFGTKAAFEAAIERYARQTPAVMAWCETARAQLPDDDRLRALLDMLGREDDTDWLRAWPEPYRVLELASMLEGEVGNGGVAQYFYNDSGSLAPNDVVALRDLGLPVQAAAIERGMAMFPHPYPTDTTERRKVLDGDGGLDDRLDTLTDVVGTDGLRPAMIAYAVDRHLLPR